MSGNLPPGVTQREIDEAFDDEREEDWQREQAWLAEQAEVEMERRAEHD